MQSWRRDGPSVPSSDRRRPGFRSPAAPFSLPGLLKRISDQGTPWCPQWYCKPLISSSFWQHHFQPALRAGGVACRFHDLRHTSVALAIAEDAHPKAIQARMGHSSINVTLDRYGHLLPELDEAIAIGFGERLAEARRSQRARSEVLHATFGDSASG